MTRPSGQAAAGSGEGEKADGIGRVIDLEQAGTPGTRSKAPSSGVAKPPPTSPSKLEEGLSDGELMAQVRAGDSAAFAALYERHKGWVVAVAYRFCGDRELALDVLQETFAFLLRRSTTLTLDGRLTTYLFPAVKNLSQTARRKRARMSSGEAVGHYADESGYHHAPRGASTPLGERGGAHDEELTCVIASLPDAQQELIYMRYVAGMMPTEIAVVLGVPVGTAKSRLFAAVRAVEAGLMNRRG